MTPWRRSLAAGLAGLAGLLAGLAAGCDDTSEPPPAAPQASPEVEQSGVLVLCTEAPYAPFVDEEDGEYTGFEVDLLRQMAGLLELQLDVRPTTYAELDDGSALGRQRCDVAAGALAVTAERERRMDFVTPHYKETLTLLRPAASDIDEVADLAGRRLAVQEDSPAAEVARRRAPRGTRIVELAGDQYMFSALRQGRVDAVLQERALNLVHTEDGRFTTVEELPTGEEYAFAVAPSDDGLRRSLDQALTTMRTERDYQELYERYFTVQ